MKLIPFEIYTVGSSIERDAFEELLTSSIEQVGMLNSLGFSSKKLIGNRAGNKFVVRRPIKYQNSFLPVAHIEIHREKSGSRLVASLIPSLFTLSFTFIFIVFATVAAISFFSEEGGEIYSLIPIGMSVIVYLVMLLGFWFEVPKIKNILSELAE